MNKPRIKLNLKTYVAFSLIVTVGFMGLVLLAGIVVPKNTLLKLSGKKAESANTTNDGGVATDAGSKDPASTQAQPGATTDPTAPTTAPGTTTPGTTAPTTAPGTTTPGTTAPTTTGAAGTAPSLTFSASPTSITTGASSTLSWSASGTATISCTAGGGWSGAKSASGSQAVTPGATASYTLVCTNSAGSSGTKTVSVTVSAPVSNCKAGGTCNAAEVATHNTNGNCWVALTGTGYNKVYNITSSFNSSHVADNGKNAASSARTCGKVISYTTLRNYAGDHSNGAKIGGNTFDTWLASFYYANYQ